MQTRSKSGIFKPKRLLSLFVALAEFEPTSFTQASKFPHWRTAIAEEYNALMANHTWDLVPLYPKQNLVGSKWVYRVKYHSDGTVERHKARLVTQGFHQQARLDYHETFCPVVKPATIRLILSLAISSRWTIHYLDVKNAFLHGHLTEDVYMK